LEHLRELLGETSGLDANISDFLLVLGFKKIDKVVDMHLLEIGEGAIFGTHVSTGAIGTYPTKTRSAHIKMKCDVIFFTC